MPTFHYRAYGVHGELAEGNIDAASEATASDALWSRGLIAFELRLGTELSWWRRNLPTHHIELRPADIAAFTREFATLDAAEIPLDDALRILSKQAASAKMRMLSSALLADVLDGSTLSDAMQKRPQIFPIDYVSVIRAGEISGAVGVVLSELADLLERRARIRAELQSALIYPIMLIVLSVISVGIVIGNLIPSIAPIFADSGRPMPTAIGVIVALESYWQEAATLLSITIAMLLAFALIASRRPDCRLAYERWKLSMPLYGDFALKRETARFARTLGTLLRAGVPLLQATVSARSVIANRYICCGIDRAADAIREGAALHKALRDETPFPEVAVRMVSIGEEAGKLDRMLMRLAELFERQTQQSVDRFMTMLTPALTVGIALVIGGLIMTVIGAVLSLNDIAVR